MPHSGTCEAAADLATEGSALDLTSTDDGLTWTLSRMPFDDVVRTACSSSSSCVAVGLDAQGGWTIARLG